MKKILYFLVFFPIFIFGQTQSENYIKNKIYKIPTSTTIANPSINEANQSITYYDGLGRPIQKIDNKQSSSGKNIVAHFEYDLFGRQIKNYLPYASVNNGLNFETSASSDVLNFPTYVGQNPYTEVQIEASPLDRVLKKASQGSAWAMGNGHEVKYDYLSNTNSDAVKFYSASATWNVSLELYDISLVNNGSSLYPINSLYKTVIKNENWTSGSNNTIELFKNIEGKLILRRAFDNNIAHDTYYVYDQYGNLTYVIPPLVTNINNQLNGLCYQYKYDRFNRLVEKKIPSKNWEYIIYDKLDRVIATGPTSSPFNDITGDGWLINKYDAVNRLIYSGWYFSNQINATVRTSLQSIQNNLTSNVNEVKVSSGSIDGVNVYYSNLVAPTSFKLLSVNYFDDYNFPDAPTSIPSQILNDNSQVVYYNNTIKPKGLSTGTWVRVVENSTSNSFEKSYLLYDKKGRIIRVYNKNYLGGYLQKDSKIDFFGKTLYTEIKHKRLNSDTELFVRNDFSYSEQDRLLSEVHTINGGLPQLLYKNEYNEMGNLISKNVGGNDISGNSSLQKINYSYNIRGWLTGINDINNLVQGTDPQDLFAFKINYNTVNDEDGYIGSPLYNGNISETYWRTRTDNVVRKYGYKYDSLNRLTDAVYQKPGNSVAVPNSYNESLSYDKNGNILSLKRNGNQDSDTNYILALEIDNLNYIYNQNSNQLAKVFDSTNNPSGFKDDSTDGTINTDISDDYNYDTKGNLLKDENKGITSIIYNQNDLPLKIIFGTNGVIEYTYNALGKKVKKKVTQGATTTVTDYLDGFQYKNNILSFFQTVGGYVNVTYCGTCALGSQYNFNYVFNYIDNIGNVRMSYTEDPVTHSLKILEENHYYPFGLKHNNYNSDMLMYIKVNKEMKIKPKPPTKLLEFNYKYNGKEWQDELGLNMYDYGARNYDPAIGRWMNIDPLAEKSRRYSPYTYCLDNPVFFVDPDGMMHQASNGTGDPSKDYSELDVEDITDMKKTKSERELVSTTATSDLTVQFVPKKNSTDGKEVVTLRTQYNSRYIETDSKGNKKEVFTQTIYTHTATVDLDKNGNVTVSKVKETVSCVEENEKGEKLVNNVSSTSYSLSDKKADLTPLQDFKTVTQAVANHRESAGMSCAQDGLNKINDANTNAGYAGTFLSTLALITKNPYVVAGGIVATAIGYATTLVTLKVSDTQPKDIILNFTYGNTVKNSSQEYPQFTPIYKNK